MVADSVGDRPGSLQQQRQYQHQYHQQSLEQQERYHRQLESLSPSSAAIQGQRPDVLSYPTDRAFQSQSTDTTDDENTTTLSHETRPKIAELKNLIDRYCQYHRNPGADTLSLVSLHLQFHMYSMNFLNGAKLSNTIIVVLTLS